MTDVKAGNLVFRCDNALEVWRAKGAYTKEPGTVKWLEQIQPGDVFYDVGANIGVYSLMAAARGAKVYAFEPHVATAASLIRQVAANGMADRVTVLTVALAYQTKYLPFHYSSKIAGSSGSQLGHRMGEDGKEFEPVAVELKHATSADSLVPTIPPPTLVKIDVDGNEYVILLGMIGLLSGPSPPRSVQVEAHHKHRHDIVKMMGRCGYGPPVRHDTEAGAKKIADGADPLTVTHNLVFSREPTNDRRPEESQARREVEEVGSQEGDSGLQDCQAEAANGGRKVTTVYVGWDSRETAAYDVARASIRRRTANAWVRPMCLESLERQGILTRKVENRNGQLWCPISDAPMATEFAISRFAVPHLHRSGWAVFMDCDVVCLADVAELLALADDRYAVMCVKHEQTVNVHEMKMVNQKQTAYARKNWSSVVLWNCSHPSNAKLTPEVLNTWPGRDLHAFKWLDDSEIGALPPEWNHLVGIDPPNEGAKVLHYTLGGLWINGWAGGPLDAVWQAEQTEGV